MQHERANIRGRDADQPDGTYFHDQRKARVSACAQCANEDREVEHANPQTASHDQQQPADVILAAGRKIIKPNNGIAQKNNH